jgi:hypothetical protein
VLLKTHAQSNEILPAALPEKSKSKSTATAVPFAVEPVDRNCRFPDPLWTPPVVPVEKVAEEAVVLTPSGIVPVALIATEL